MLHQGLVSRAYEILHMRKSSSSCILTQNFRKYGWTNRILQNGWEHFTPLRVKCMSKACIIMYVTLSKLSRIDYCLIKVNNVLIPLIYFYWLHHWNWNNKLAFLKQTNWCSNHSFSFFSSERSKKNLLRMGNFICFEFCSLLLLLPFGAFGIISI